jgi:hypothetical protein
MSKDITVFTTLFGDTYNKLNEPLLVDPDADYVCYTDNPNVKSAFYKIILINTPVSNNPVLSAKYVRLFPHEFIKTPYNVYIDTTMSLKVTPFMLIHKYLTSRHPLALYPNYLRSTVKEERDYLVNVRGLDSVILDKQLSDYASEGFTDDMGLYYSGFLLRKTFDESLISFNKRWWEDIIKYSARIEMSFPYILWKDGLNINPILEGNAHNNELYNYIK